MAMRAKRVAERRRKENQRRLMIVLSIVLVIVIIFVGGSLLRNKKEKTDEIALNDTLADSQSVEGITLNDAEQNARAILEEAEKSELTADGNAEESSPEISIPLLNSSEYQFQKTDASIELTNPEVTSTYALVVDLSDNHVVAQRNAYDRINPASMTKILTLLVAAERVTNLDDTFTMTIDITDYAYVHDCSSVGFFDGEVVTIRDLLYGTILPSGGDAAVGLATYVAGSHEAFVELMNQKLLELGLSGTAHFTNCVGLYDDNHYCSIYDMAVILEAAMKNNLCREVLNTRTYTTSNTEQHPEGITVSNWFMRRIEDKEMGGEILGAKTGYVVQSGNCAASCYKRADGTEFICVTGDASSSWRAIYDHVAAYNIYAAGNTAYVKQ